MLSISFELTSLFKNTIDYNYTSRQLVLQSIIQYEIEIYPSETYMKAI